MATPDEKERPQHATMTLQQVIDAVHELQMVVFGTPESPTPAGMKRTKRHDEAKALADAIKADTKK